MNEQLVVKNFGPIKDATVDFKRVTVFIGPTGGGKSTLAKLAMLFRLESFGSSQSRREKLELFASMSATNYLTKSTKIVFTAKQGDTTIINSKLSVTYKPNPNAIAVISKIRAQRDEWTSHHSCSHNHANQFNCTDKR
jgi:predicted ATPase